MDHDYDALLKANLEQVFNQRDDARRDAAIAGLYTDQPVMYEPAGPVQGAASLGSRPWCKASTRPRWWTGASRGCGCSFRHLSYLTEKIIADSFKSVPHPPIQLPDRALSGVCST